VPSRQGSVNSCEARRQELSVGEPVDVGILKVSAVDGATRELTSLYVADLISRSQRVGKRVFGIDDCKLEISCPE